MGKRRLSRTNIGPGRKRGKKSSLSAYHMARKGNPISVRLDLNRSSDSSRFSEGDRESHRMGQSFPSVFLYFQPTLTTFTPRIIFHYPSILKLTEVNFYIYPNSFLTANHPLVLLKFLCLTFFDTLYSFRSSSFE